MCVVVVVMDNRYIQDLGYMHTWAGKLLDDLVGGLVGQGV